MGITVPWLTGKQKPAGSRSHARWWRAEVGPQDDPFQSGPTLRGGRALGGRGVTCNPPPASLARRPPLAAQCLIFTRRWTGCRRCSGKRRRARSEYPAFSAPRCERQCPGGRSGGLGARPARRGGGGPGPLRAPVEQPQRPLKPECTASLLITPEECVCCPSPTVPAATAGIPTRP